MRLPVEDLAQVQISGTGEGLGCFLEPIDSALIRDRIGPEKLKHKKGPIEVTEGALVKLRDHKLRGMRYLFRDDAEVIVGAINITKIDRKAVLSNIFIHPDYRGRGIASQLVEVAKRDFPRLMVDTSMTEAGAKFFGYNQQMVDAARAKDLAKQKSSPPIAPHP